MVLPGRERPSSGRLGQAHATGTTAEADQDVGALEMYGPVDGGPDLTRFHPGESDATQHGRQPSGPGPAEDGCPAFESTQEIAPHPVQESRGP